MASRLRLGLVASSSSHLVSFQYSVKSLRTPARGDFHQSASVKEGLSFVFCRFLISWF